MMKNYIKKEKGNITVEAAIIFPVIFFCIIGVMFIGVFLYQKVLLQSMVNHSVERQAAVWNNPYKNIETGFVKSEDLKKGGLYWQIIDLQKKEKQENLRDYINSRMHSYSILKGTYEILDVDVKNYIIYKKLFVEIEGRYNKPAGGIMGVFGFGNDIIISANAEAIINKPVDFIRNTDFILDVVEDLESTNPTVAKLGSNLRGVLSKMKSTLRDVFELGK